MDTEDLFGRLVLRLERAGLHLEPDGEVFRVVRIASGEVRAYGSLDELAAWWRVRVQPRQKMSNA